MRLGIYIHIPFCKSRCYYCDFCSMEKEDAIKDELIPKYIDALIKEILENAELLAQNEVDSIYFGGGTPSVIDPKYICSILQVIRSCTNVLDDSEITIEVNPESVDEEKLKKYKNAGINRISIGLQSANDDVLNSIGRISTKEMFYEAYNKVLNTGFTNISTDIICGLPKDDLESFKGTVEFVLGLPSLKHISAYSLELHEGSKLDFLVKNGFLSVPSEDDERTMKYMLDEMLKQAGFDMYEISNYSKPGYESLHNLKYWTGKPYLGFGASAASYINSTRYTNTSNIQEYIMGINSSLSKRQEVEQLDLLDLEKEFVILGLRLTRGISIIEFRSKFGTDIYDIFGQEINKFLKNGLLEACDGYIKLSAKGQDLANVVWQEFI